MESSGLTSSMSNPCPNCHSSHASHYVVGADYACALCGADCRAKLAKLTTLEGLLATRFRELTELVSVYRGLIQLRSPVRTMLLGRMRGCLDDIAALEGMDLQTLPEANLDAVVEDFDPDEDDEDEARDALK